MEALRSPNMYSDPDEMAAQPPAEVAQEIIAEVDELYGDQPRSQVAETGELERLNDKQCEMAVVYHIGKVTGRGCWYKNVAEANKNSRGIVRKLGDETGLSGDQIKNALKSATSKGFLRLQEKSRPPEADRPPITKNALLEPEGRSAINEWKVTDPEEFKSVTSYILRHQMRTELQTVMSVRDEIHNEEMELGRNELSVFEDLDTLDSPKALDKHLKDLYKKQAELMDELHPSKGRKSAL